MEEVNYGVIMENIKGIRKKVIAIGKKYNLVSIYLYGSYCLSDKLSENTRLEFAFSFDEFSTGTSWHYGEIYLSFADIFGEDIILIELGWLQEQTNYTTQYEYRQFQKGHILLYSRELTSKSKSELSIAELTELYCISRTLDINYQEDIDYFFDEYMRGRTPNPCIACNRYIKFEGLLNKARELGASYIATGHYACIDRSEEDVYRLRKGFDLEKDQSYVLYHLNQKILPHVLLPLGGFSKSETRRMAEAYHLPVAHKAESQEICFIPRDDYKAYLLEKRPECARPGEIVDRTGNVLGMHEGVAFYTIGQRRGLGIAAPQPLYVTALDAVKNQVVVGGADAVHAREFIASDLNWTMWNGLDQERSVQAKIRYGKREAPARIIPRGSESIWVCFAEPQRAVTPGQSVVFYERDVVLGGGIIDEVID